MADIMTLIAQWFSVFLSFLLHIDVHLFELADSFGFLVYGILFLIIFCETGLVVTPFLPGDSLLFAAGALAGAGRLNLFLLMGVLWIGAVLGDAVNYQIGRFLGPPVFERNYRLLRKEYLLQAQAFYERHGGKAILLARFVPIVRTFAPFVAGVASMNPSRFFLFNITGATCWICLLAPAGYALSNAPVVKNHFSLLVYGIILVSCLPVVVGGIKARWKKGNPQSTPRPQ